MSDDYNLNKDLEGTAQGHQSIVKRTHYSPYSHIHSFWKYSLNTYCVPYNRMTEGATEITKVHSLPKGTATDPHETSSTFPFCILKPTQQTMLLMSILHAGRLRLRNQECRSTPVCYLLVPMTPS